MGRTFYPAMELPLDPFEEFTPEGLDEALGTIADEDDRERVRLLVEEFGRAKLDADAIIAQRTFRDAWRAIGALEDEARVRSVLLVMVAAVNRFMRNDAGYAAWKEGRAGAQ
jgi:hypothetical protein